MKIILNNSHSLNESILDFPKDDLCQEVWEKDSSDEYHLTDDAQSIIYPVLNWIQRRFSIPKMKAVLVGSLTSNSYASDSDVDIHVSSDLVSDEVAEYLADEVKSVFKDEFIVQYPEFSQIGGYRLEVYFQKNEFQDRMSVGCYDLINRKWIVGPEFKPKGFDPYASYYFKDLDYIDGSLDDIREVVMTAYEKALVYLKTDDFDTRRKIGVQLLSLMSNASMLFDEIRQKRSVISNQSTSPSKAAILRQSEAWKVADSSYKLISKLGYQLLLRKMSSCKEKVENDEMTIEQAALEIVQAADEGISSQNLIDSENEFLTEDFKKWLASIAAAGAIAWPGLAKPPDIAPGALKNKATLHYAQPAQKQKIAKTNMTTNVKQMAGKFSIRNLINIVARTLFGEAQGETYTGKEAIASTIGNRAGWDNTNLVDVVFADGQFDAWKKYGPPPTSDDDYTYDDKSSRLTGKQLASWNDCVEISTRLVNGTFTSTIGNRNCYMNKKTASKKNLEAWGDLCDYKVGNHHFGYQKMYDGTLKKNKAAQNAKRALMIHVVQSGDTASQIASKYNTTVAQLKKNNPSIKDINKLSIGQKIKV